MGVHRLECKHKVTVVGRLHRQDREPSFDRRSRAPTGPSTFGRQADHAPGARQPRVWRVTSALHLFLACGPFALFNRDTILDHYPRRIGSWGSVMGLDTGTVFKRSVLCPHCNEEYLFTLRAIADNPELRCYGCGGTICLRDSIFEQLVSDVRNSLEAIAAAPPSFISARPRSAV
jgi:hypothetical protein